MNLNTGNSVRRVTSISVMLQGSYMLFQKIWLLIYQLTSKFPNVILVKASSALISYSHIGCLGMCFTSMLMRMFHWDLGLLVWTWSILMTGDSVVVPHQVIF